MTKVFGWLVIMLMLVSGAAGAQEHKQEPKKPWTVHHKVVQTVRHPVHPVRHAARGTKHVSKHVVHRTHRIVKRTPHAVKHAAVAVKKHA